MERFQHVSIVQWIITMQPANREIATARSPCIFCVCFRARVSPAKKMQREALKPQPRAATALERLDIFCASGVSLEELFSLTVDNL